MLAEILANFDATWWHCLYNRVVVERCPGIVCFNGHNVNCIFTTAGQAQAIAGYQDAHLRNLSDVRRLCLPPA